MKDPAQSSELEHWKTYDIQNPDGSWTTVAQKILEELEKLEQLPNVYPEKINGLHTHVHAIYKSAITERINQLKGGE